MKKWKDVSIRVKVLIPIVLMLVMMLVYMVGSLYGMEQMHQDIVSLAEQNTALMEQARVDDEETLAQVAELAAERQASYQTTVISCIVSGVIFVLIFIFCVINLDRKVTWRLRRHIEKLDEIIESIEEGHGDLSKRLMVLNQDEMGRLAADVNRFIDILERIMKKINLDSNSLAMIVQDVTEKADNSNSSACDVSAVAEQLSATMEEVSSTVSNVDENANRVMDELTKLQKTTEEILKYSDEMKARADELEESAQNNKAETGRMIAPIIEKIKRAVENSKNVEKVNELTDEILSISSQTNLLSLNASIEAARAGEAGKGFAVVADQIRKLAEQSAASAVSTRELIEGSIHDVEDGNKAVALVSETLDEVIKGINDIADTSKSLSENSQSQATAMEQAEQGVNQISEVVQSNSAMAQETSATSEELSAQAETLDNLVRQFKLREQK